MISQVIFIGLTLVVSYFAFVQFGQVVNKIRLGKAEEIKGDEGWRWKNVLLIAFGQKKMFKRWIPASLHLFIYVAFLFTQIELIEILIDGFLGFHRFFAPYLGVFYTILINFIELLSVLALIATIAFLWRRNVQKLPRFVMAEMKGWPTLDGNLILVGELLLLIGIFSMNGADMMLQSRGHDGYPDTGQLLMSSWLGTAFFDGFNSGQLVLIERMGWWLHIAVVFGFITYLPHSKHLHIFFAFPNVYFSKRQSRGEMNNMPEIMNEVKSMMGLSDDSGAEMTEEIPDFGAKDVTDLSWKTLLEAYTCTECGRCSSVCPANLTGKKLSPRKIMMDIRDRADEVWQTMKKADRTDKQTEKFDDGKSLFDYISREEIFACTTCNACVEACPVLINPLEPILELRRYDILTNSAGPSDWLPMFNSIENGGAVWQMANDRDQWAKEMSGGLD